MRAQLIVVGRCGRERRVGVHGQRVAHATGDGKTYVVQVRVEGTRNAYITRVETTAGTAEVYDLPVDDFRPVNFMLEPAAPGDPDTPATLDPSRIVQSSIYILDKQVGPFELRITKLDAVR